MIDIVLNRNNVSRKLKKGVVVIPCHEPGPGFLTWYVVVFFFMRDDWYFCWYWWNCWASLLKRSFRVMIINVYTLILRIFTDLHTCRQWSESIVLAGKDTMTPVLRIASPYRGLDTYAHIHKYLGERVVWLWLVEMYKFRHVIRRSSHQRS